ncbi:MAG TPA: DNA-formamidopyrimidine glycosylase family protein [Solirubrobacteraceae bacterium]|jgi:formamidopyrimidine-DNA glycosylase|nr:DNA-formamidopyrimidine glycosylase family protein [Solirubrobacteraceae bacterium]
MPELPEVEITARRLDAALRGAEIESALAPGINALKTFDPPLSALAGRTVAGVRRRGKHLIVDVASNEDANQRGGDHGGGDDDRTGGGGAGDRLALLIHLMSAGRLQLYDKRAGPRDRTSRLLVRVRLPPGGETAAPEAELRLREFGSKQAAWVKLLRAEDLERDEALATLGHEAWPDPGDPEALRELLAAPRPLHAMLRDQRTIAGIGRSWVDEILWEARLSPYKRGADLTGAEAVRLREAIVEVLSGAIDHYERTVALPIPDKLPMPLRVHRHEGSPCPRCGETLRSVHFEDYTIAYCPACQTDGRVLKDRRLSRLLK